MAPIFLVSSLDQNLLDYHKILIYNEILHLKILATKPKGFCIAQLDL